jgi:hypothetical protein
MRPRGHGRKRRREEELLMMMLMMMMLLLMDGWEKGEKRSDFVFGFVPG